MGKLSAFLAGAITGAVGLGVTACLVDKYCNHPSSSHCSDDDIDTNENAEAKTCAESSSLLSEEQTGETSAANAESQSPADSFGKIAETIAEAIAPAQTAQSTN